MTAVDQDLDLTSIGHLDHDVPCTLTRRHGAVRCDDPADWWVLLRPHCTGTEGQDHLLCAKHYAEMQDGVSAYCATCWDTAVVLDYVIRTERIRP